MPDDKYKPALRAALRMHEIGSDTPYRLYFAAKGNSGGSLIAGTVKMDVVEHWDEVLRLKASLQV